MKTNIFYENWVLWCVVASVSACVAVLVWVNRYYDREIAYIKQGYVQTYLPGSATKTWQKAISYNMEVK